MSFAANPRAAKPLDQGTQEATGQIASDSLAAESLKSGGAFASGHATASSQPGASSTFATTDTSGASKLNPAPDASARDDGDRNANTKYPEAAGPAPSFDGTHTLAGSTGGPSSAKHGSTHQPGGSGGGAAYETNTSGATGTSGEQYRSSQVSGPAPTVYGSHASEGQLKPKGANLTEGGFGGDSRKADGAEIGSRDDPGRVAEEEFQRRDAAVGGGAGARQTELDTEGAYDALREESA